MVEVVLYANIFSEPTKVTKCYELGNFDIVRIAVTQNQPGMVRRPVPITMHSGYRSVLVLLAY